MFPIPPPPSPLLLSWPIEIRWYAFFIAAGSALAAWVAARRAQKRGIDPDHVWNQFVFSMIFGLVCARAYYVAFEWPNFAGRSWLEIINPHTGGLAIHGALLSAPISGWLYTRWAKINFIDWADICVPTILIGQAMGRWGNYFNQEAYGRPTDSGFGLLIDEQFRLNPYRDMQKYPPTTLFHATFLYESLWNLSGFGLIMLIERRLKAWLRRGDSALLYVTWYGLGRFWVESFRVDSLCTNMVGGSCDGAFRAAQLVSLAFIAVGVIGLVINHLRRQATPRPVEQSTEVTP